MPHALRQPKGYSALSNYRPRPVPIPERCLASAVIKQALHDFQRGHPEAQEEVAQWLQDLKAVSFWSDMIDVDAEGFRDVIARTRRC